MSYLLAVKDAKKVRQEFISGEEKITSRVGALINRFPIDVSNFHSSKSELIRIPFFDHYTDQGLTLGIRVMQIFMPQDPWHIRQNRLTSYSLNSTGEPNEQVRSEQRSYDFLSEGYLLQNDDADLALEAIENGQWLNKQQGFLGRLDLVDKALSVEPV
jgi:hypothetical protein